MTQEGLERKGAGGSRTILYLILFLLLTAAAIVVQIRLRGFGGPFSDNILLIILVNANFLLLAFVIFLMVRSLWKLSVERRSGVLGAKFRTKLVAAFVSISVIPTILLFLIASGMYTRSIERLFSLRIENSLRDSVSVAQDYYSHLSRQALSFGRQISAQIAEEGLPEQFDAAVLEEHLRQRSTEYDLGAVELFSPSGDGRAAVVTPQFPEKAFATTSRELVEKALEGKEGSAVRSVGQGEIVRGIVPVYRRGAPEIIGALSVGYYVPESLSGRLNRIQAGYAEYRTTFKQKEPIKLAYRLGFLSVTLSLLLAAIWIALRVSAGITVPIRKLAEGTREVAQGNLDHRVDVHSGDEVGLLVESFNSMTERLKNSQEQLRQEGEHKDIILSNIDTGVVSMDRSGKITTVNPAAARILGIDPGDVRLRRYDEAFSFIDLGPVRSLFRRLEEGQGRAEGEISVTVRGRALTLRMRITTLRNGAGAVIGSVITFDDLTELLRAQKAATWQHVARQIAHEVKNPLTPIKLSAERLRKKYAERSGDFDAVFEEGSLMIIKEVDGLERLLNEFSEFARMPRSVPVRGPIAPVIESALQLFEGAHAGVSFDRDVAAPLPDVLVDQEQMKRVFINLFKNAVESMKGGGTVRVTVRPVPGGGVRIEVADDGPGFTEEDASRLFEPYFSRTKKGGGLGLAIVERIIADHDGSIHARRNDPRGAVFIIELPAAKEQRA